MLEIYLVRHGRPVGADGPSVCGSDYHSWTQEYDQAPLDPNSAPPRELVARAVGVACVVTSTLSRSRASAALLTSVHPLLCDSVFDETPVPSAFKLGLALRPPLWDLLARVAWFCGWSGGTESLAVARKRAQRAADRLAELARAYGTVMLVGHGMMNALIRQELRRTGWSSTRLRFGYWSHIRLRSEGEARITRT
jgi:broad specificity phosphatase PhoE